MKKTFITRLPDKAGAFLNASKIIAMAGGNMTRVSYNKAIDVHLLFIEVSASEAQLDQIASQLQAVGYILNDEVPGQTVLIEFKLLNIPNAVRPVLELIHKYEFNITYISAHGNETPGTETEYQDFKIGLYIQSSACMKCFLDEAAKICELRVLDYDKSQKVLDNTVFYLSFAQQVSEMLGLSKEQENSLIADSNQIMQNLDERSGSPYKTFSYIGKFAEMINTYKGDAFFVTVTKRELHNGMTMYCLEPPCGSNTYIFETENDLLFIDCGFPCYEKEMLKILREMFTDFDSRRKELILTHPDIDHCGLMNLFDRVYGAADALRNFECECAGMASYREQNVLHAPYYRISRILAGYIMPNLSNFEVIGADKVGTPLCYIGQFAFKDLQFDLYAGNGGHTKGEIVLVNEENKLVFTGDIMVNIKGFSKEQAAFNALAPYLMTSVNLDSAMASEERNALLKMFDPEKYVFCCGHGAIIEPK